MIEHGRGPSARRIARPAVNIRLSRHEAKKALSSDTSNRGRAAGGIPGRITSCNTDDKSCVRSRFSGRG